MINKVFQKCLIVLLAANLILLPGCVSFRKGISPDIKILNRAQTPTVGVVSVKASVYDEHGPEKDSRKYDSMEKVLLQTIASALSESGQFSIVTTSALNTEKSIDGYELTCDVLITWNFIRETFLSPLSVYTLCIIPGLYVRHWNFALKLTDMHGAIIWQGGYKEKFKTVCWLPLLPLGLNEKWDASIVLDEAIKEVTTQMLTDMDAAGIFKKGSQQ
jgi:hypothetical protein